MRWKRENEEHYFYKIQNEWKEDTSNAIIEYELIGIES